MTHGQSKNPESCILASVALIGYILIILFISIYASAVLGHMCDNTVACKKFKKQQVCQKSQKSLFLELSS